MDYCIVVCCLQDDFFQVYDIAVRIESSQCLDLSQIIHLFKTMGVCVYVFLH